MKKVILILSLSLFSMTVFGQAQFGVKGGLNVASVHGDNLDNTKNVMKFYGGAYANFAISEAFKIQPELLYVGQGTKYSSKESQTDTGGNVVYALDVDGDLKLNYIQIPIMMQYYFTEGFYGEFGPQFGFLMNAKADVKGTETSAGSSISIDRTDDLKDSTKGFDFGLGFGIGYQLASGLNFGARYNLGVSNILKDVQDVNGKDVKWTTGGIMFGVGYTFGAGE